VRVFFFQEQLMTIANVNQPAPRLDPRFTQVLNFLQSGQNRKAMELAERLGRVTALKPTARAFSALAAAMENDRDMALVVLADFPSPAALDSAEALHAVGSAWFKLGDTGAAIPFLLRARKADERHPLLAARLGACLLAVGRIQEALPLLQQAVELLPKSGGAWLNLARARLGVGEAESALVALDKAGALPDKDPGLYRRSRVEALSCLGRHEEAEALLRDAADSGEEGATSVLVQMLAARGRHDEAWHLLKEALEKSPDDTGLMELAAELAQVRGRFGEAADWLKRALDKQPEDAGLWARLAILSSRRLGEINACAAADRALELTVGKSGPQRAHALAAHAHVLTEGGEHAAAESAYREALALLPQFVPALSGLGHLLMQRGKVDAATACFAELKKVAPLQGWSGLIQAREVPEDPKVLEQMAQAARRPSLKGPVQAHLLFTLAAAWEAGLADHR
jgi:tetratricopeptide (TPR) repeat protein